jgi:hypothetical protein
MDFSADSLKTWGAAVLAVAGMGYGFYEKVTDDPVLVEKAQVAETQTLHLNRHYHQMPDDEREIETLTGSVVVQHFAGDGCVGVSIQRGRTVTHLFLVDPGDSGLSDFTVPASQVGPGRCLSPEAHPYPWSARIVQQGSNGWVRRVLTFDPERNGRFRGCQIWQDYHPASGSYRFGPWLRCIH